MTPAHTAFAVCRFAFPPTSAQTWRICWEICCRWTWPSALVTSGTESTISRATSGSPPPIGSPSTRGRWAGRPFQSQLLAVRREGCWQRKTTLMSLLVRGGVFESTLIRMQVVSHHLGFWYYSGDQWGKCLKQISKGLLIQAQKLVDLTETCTVVHIDLF